MGECPAWTGAAALAAVLALSAGVATLVVTADRKDHDRAMQEARHSGACEETRWLLQRGMLLPEAEADIRTVYPGACPGEPGL